MISFLLGILGGIVAWFVTMLIGQPILTFWALRRQVIKALVQYNASGIDERSQSSKWLDERSTVLRTHGAELIAFAATEPLAPMLLAKIGYDPLGAGVYLTSLSCLAPGDATRPHIYGEVLKALRVSHWVM
jgi:hypothetical protein